MLQTHNLNRNAFPFLCFVLPNKISKINLVKALIFGEETLNSFVLFKKYFAMKLSLRSQAV